VVGGKLLADPGALRHDFHAENTMPTAIIGRRQLLQRAAALLGAAGVVYRATAAAPAACATLDGSDGSLRRSLNYVEASKDPKQHCSACAFFSEPGGACGKCMIFNGPTNVNGHCDSWAAKS
jgi:hypothetical protein